MKPSELQEGSSQRLKKQNLYRNMGDTVTSEGHELPSERLEFALQMPHLDPGGTGEIINLWAKTCLLLRFFSHWYSTLRGSMMKTHRLLLITIKG